VISESFPELRKEWRCTQVLVCDVVKKALHHGSFCEEISETRAQNKNKKMPTDGMAAGTTQHNVNWVDVIVS
jgi:hypothetical protein